MESRKAVLSAPRTLDMVPLGEILQGRSNQGVKAYSDNSDRYNSDSGILKGVFPPNWKKAWSSGEPTPAWPNNTFGQGVKYIQESPVTSAFECSLSNHQSINVQGQLQSGLEFKDSVGSPPIGVAVDLPPKVKNICPSGADQDAAFLRRLENLPPEQESQVKIPHVDLQQRQRKARHYTGGER